ncbi:MAG: hypothetical protein LBM93_14385 [Oscillospiraceae bacterium]|jgi:hypothetical protein|nr:hypothetical protein [Oscillospiraceae bacterium]
MDAVFTNANMPPFVDNSFAYLTSVIPVIFPDDFNYSPIYEYFNPENKYIIFDFYAELNRVFKCEIAEEAFALINNYIEQSITATSDINAFFVEYRKYAEASMYRKQNRAINFLSIAINDIISCESRMQNIHNADSDFEELYNKFVDMVSQNQAVNLENLSSLNRFSNVIKNYTGSKIISVEKKEDIILDKIVDDNGKVLSVNGVKIVGSVVVDGILFSGNYTIGKSPDGLYNTSIDINCDRDLFPNGLSWLKFNNPGINIEIPESGQNPMGTVSGMVEKIQMALEMDIIPTNGIRHIKGGFSEAMTATEAFSAFTGGVDFLAELPEPLRNLGGIGIKTFNICYDAKKSKVVSFTLTLGVASAWTILNKPLLKVNPTITLTIYNPTDFTNRKFAIRLEGDCSLGEEGNGTFKMIGAYPPLSLSLTLTNELDVQKLLKEFDIDFDSALKITALTASVKPSEKQYRFTVAVGEVLELGEKFKINSLSLHIGQNNSGFQAAFAGSITICKVNGYAHVRYSTSGGWILAAGVSFGKTPVKAEALINNYGDDNICFLDVNGSDAPNPMLGHVDVSYAMKTGAWSLSAAAENIILPFIPNVEMSASLDIGRDETSKFFCTLSGEVVWEKIDIRVSYSYKTGENCFTLEWNGFIGKIIKSAELYYAELDIHINFGNMVETMVGWVTGGSFGLDEPWGSFLNSIEIKCQLRYDFNSKSVSLNLLLEKVIELGFAQIKGISLEYKNGEDGKKGAFISLDGNFPWLSITNDSMGNNANKLGWDASKPNSAPAPNGKGNAYFNLRMLILGQHFDLFNGNNPDNITAVMDALKNITPDFSPKAKADIGWVAAIDFGVLKQDNGEYLVDTQVVFYDPNLYALRVSVHGILNGLVFEILYRKINDTLGVFKGTVTLPDKIRYLNLGAYKLTLPILSAEIYTDGSFRIDLGFPIGGDFSRSFSFEGMAGPIPIIGAAGIYFGRLSGNAGAENVPQTSNGIFNPITVFGFGIKFGIGKSIDAGILKAGFSLTMTAVLEGVCAEFSSFSGDIRCDYYNVSGLLAISGALYGTVDFVIISASVSAAISVNAKFTFEAYRASLINLSVDISVSASLKINLWLFSINISFSFSAHIETSFTIGENSTAPWDNAISNKLPLQIDYNITLNFNNLIPDGTITNCIGYISLPLSISYTPSPSVTAALLLTLDNESFKAFSKTAACFIIAAASESGTIADIMNTTPDADFINAVISLFDNEMIFDVDIINRFLSDFININIVSEEMLKDTNAENIDIDGVFFPFSPNTIVNGKRLSSCSVLSSEDIEHMKEMFRELALTVENETAPSFGRIKNNQNNNISASERIFCDWFIFTEKQILKAIAAYADGTEKLSDILAKINYDNIGGMISRYNLHGLRITLEDGEKSIAELAGTYFYNVLPTATYTFSSDINWFTIPEQYTVVPESELYQKLSAFLQYEQFKPIYSVTNETPMQLPQSVGFAPATLMCNRAVWLIPDALPKGGESYNLKIIPVNDADTFATPTVNLAALITIRVRKTEIPGLYLILGSSDSNTKAMSDIVKNNLNVTEIRIYCTSGTAYTELEMYCLDIVRLDLSTVTHPPESNKFEDSDYGHICKRLFEAIVTNNGGYYLVMPSKNNPNVFNESGETTLSFIFTFDTATDINITAPAVTAVISDTSGAQEFMLIAEASKTIRYMSETAAAVSVVNIGYEIKRDFLVSHTNETDIAKYIDNNFSLFRYRVEQNGDFSGSGYSAPMSETNGVYKFTIPTDTLAGGNYASVGKTIIIRGEWLDMFGGTASKSFTLSAICGYKDSLTSVSEYPYTQFNFDIDNSNVILTCEPADAAEIDINNLQGILRKFDRIIRELKDKNGINITFTCDVLAASGAVTLLDWVIGIRTYFAENIGQPVCKTKPIYTASYPILRIQKNDVFSFIPIAAAINIKRNGCVQAGFEKVANVSQINCNVPVVGDLRAFAKRYENVVNGVRVVGSGGQHKGDIYEVSRLEGFINFGDAGIFAPPPLFDALFTGSAQGYSYKNQVLSKKTLSYISTDLSRLLANAFNIIDDVFVPDITAAAVYAEYSFDQIEKLKTSIAESLSKRLQALFADEQTVPFAKAVEVFKQTLLYKLSSFFDTKSVLSIPVSVLCKLDNARIYGAVVGETKAAGLDFGTVKIDLCGDATETAVIVKAADTIRSSDGDVMPYANIKFGLDITHIECDVEEITDGFVYSDWFGGVADGNIVKLLDAEYDLPFPESFFPETPFLSEQSFVYDVNFCASYRFTFTKSYHYPQVKDKIKVTYNTELTDNDAVNPLVDAIAAFDGAGADIIAELKTVSANVLKSYPATDEYKMQFAKAAEALITLMTGLDNALKNQTFVDKNSEQSPQNDDTVSFTVSESSDNGDFSIQIDVQGIIPEIDGYVTEKSDVECCYKFKKNNVYLTAADGQSIMDRSYILPSRKILSAKSAVAEIICEANRNLVPLRETSSEFILTTDKATFSSSAKCSFIVSDLINLNERYTNDDIKALIKCFFNEVTEGKSVKTAAECRVVLKNGAEMPLFMQIPTVACADDLAAHFTERIMRFGETIPAALKDNTYTFRLSFRFEDVLEIMNVYVSVFDFN